MQRAMLVRVAMSLACLVSLVATAPAASKKPDRDAEATTRVTAVLEREAAESAETLDRRALLEEAFATQPQPAAARWQAGYLRYGEEWISHEQFTPEADLPKTLIDYRVLRNSTFPTAAGHLKLADWCRKNGLEEQEQAHLLAALPLVTDTRQTTAIHERLGHRLLNGEWLTRQEIKDLERLSREAEKSLARWQKQLEEIRKQLAGSPRQKKTAQERLYAINDPEAIPAIEAVLCNDSEANAQSAVQILKRIPSYKASQSLARVAVLSPWTTIRRAATEALKTRSLEDFAPSLVAALYTPLDSQYAMAAGPRGELYYWSVLTRENQDQKEVSRLGVTVTPVNIWVRTGFGRQDNQALARVLQTRVQHDFRRVLDDLSFARERSAEQQNAVTEQLNHRVSDVLAAVSEQDAGPNPAAWWNWWADFRDTERPSGKPTVIVNEEQQSIAIPRYVAASSCLTAGTPIWTNQGFQPVEQIRVGDLVLAKDIESGELAYKPVVMTTVRRPVETLRIDLGDETITATGGHHFWISGEGWEKTRRLGSQPTLHTVTGTVHVQSVEQGPTEPVYNLVVDDFHTYFVGQSKILSHDVTTPQPTDVRVPGLASR